MEKITYSDSLVRITEYSIFFKRYFFPFGSKRIELSIFFSTIILIILGLYFHYRIQYLMFFKVRPLLKQHGIQFTGIFPLRYKKDLTLYEELCCKNDLQPDFSVSVRTCEKRSWILIISSSMFCIAFLMLKAILD